MKVQNVKMSDIELGENSRIDIKQNEQLVLTNSIREKGLLQPVGIRKNPKYKAGGRRKKYILNFGYRRFKACNTLNMQTIPSHILNDTKDSAEYEIVNLVENLHRSNINDYDKGKMYSDMMKKYKLTSSELAVRLGVNRSNVQTCVDLVKRVPAQYAGKIANSNEAKSTIKKGKISSSIAKRILGNERKHHLSKPQLNKMFEYGRQDGTSTKDIDNVFRLIASGIPFTTAVKKAKDTKIISIDIPVSKDEYEVLLNECGGITDVKGELVNSLYGVGDLLVRRP